MLDKKYYEGYEGEGRVRIWREENEHASHCRVPCYNEPMQEFERKWRAKRRLEMKYYSFKPCGVETTKFCEPELFGEWEEEGLWKNKWRNRELKLPVTMTVKNKYNPGDYPLARSKLVSQKLLDVIKQLNKDYEALPTQLYYKEKDPIWGIYYSMIFPEYEAFNFEKSRYTQFRNRILDLEKLVLSKEKLSHADNENSIFVLKETDLDIICTEIAKDMIESAGIRDVSFTELPVE